MGKTKTAFIAGAEETLSGKEKYEKKKQKKAEEAKSNIEVKAEVSSKDKKKTGRSKKYLEAKSAIDRNRLYPVEEAVDLIKKTSYSKFDGSVELHLLVKKDGITAQVKLPHSTGKDKKVEVANEETLNKLKAGTVDFDVLLATPEMMPKLVAFARILGPKGMMPNPKNGTLIKSEADAKKFSADSVTVKTQRKAPVIHTLVGKVSLDGNKLADNTKAMIAAVGKNQIVKAYLSASMSPSVKLQIN